MSSEAVEKVTDINFLHNFQSLGWNDVICLVGGSNDYHFETIYFKRDLWNDDNIQFYSRTGLAAFSSHTIIFCIIK